MKKLKQIWAALFAPTPSPPFPPTQWAELECKCKSCGEYGLEYFQIPATIEGRNLIEHVRTIWVKCCEGDNLCCQTVVSYSNKPYHGDGPQFSTN